MKYRYINPEFRTLFPDEVDTYEPYVIREAINNAIAHQDYTLGGEINVIEYEDKLVFTNKGNFIPQSIDNVLKEDANETTQPARSTPVSARLHSCRTYGLCQGFERAFPFCG